MASWIFQNSQGIVAILEVVGLVIIGFFSLTGIFSEKTGERRNESEKLADGLIERLQKTVNQNALDMTTMSERIDAQQKEIHQLQGKNEAYLQMITLRDPATVKIFEEAPEIFSIARQTNQTSKDNGKAIERLTETINEFIQALPPLTPTMTR